MISPLFNALVAVAACHYFYLFWHHLKTTKTSTRTIKHNNVEWLKTIEKYKIRRRLRKQLMRESCKNPRKSSKFLSMSRIVLVFAICSYMFWSFSIFSTTRICFSLGFENLFADLGDVWGGIEGCFEQVWGMLWKLSGKLFGTVWEGKRLYTLLGKQSISGLL